MSQTEPAKTSSDALQSGEIPCAKCEEANPPGSNTCHRCGAHLWVACHHCGDRNRRVEIRCGACHGKLHHTGWKRFSKKLSPNKRNLTIWQSVLLVVAVWVAYRIVIYLAEYRPPVPE